LTDKKDFFISNGYKLFESIWKIKDNLTKLWKRMEKYFTKNDIKLILTQKDHHSNNTHLFHLPSCADFSYVEAFVNLVRTTLSADEIKELLSQRRTLCQESFLTHYLKLAENKTVYELTYNFSKEFLTHEELKDLIFVNKDASFIQKVAGNEEIFPLGMKILSEFYTNDEIRDLLMDVDDRNTNILSWAIGTITWNLRHDVIDYLKDMFKGREEKLKILFENRNIHDQNIFVKFNDRLYSEKAQPFLDLAKEIFTDDEIKNLVNNN
jgi:hypothetical protein